MTQGERFPYQDIAVTVVIVVVEVAAAKAGAVDCYLYFVL